MKLAPVKVAIIMPAYNEARVIGSVLAALPQTIRGVDHIDCIVVDDGSSDETSAVAKGRGVLVLRHLINRGLGAALATGLGYARDEGYDLAVTMDADGQHDPQELPKILEPLLTGSADVVIGTRLTNPAGMPIHRRFGIWFFNAITAILFGVPTTDSQSGLRAFRGSALQKMAIAFEGMEVSSGFFSEIGRLRLRYREVPIRAIYTTYSLAKGQRPLNGFSILFRLIWYKLHK